MTANGIASFTQPTNVLNSTTPSESPMIDFGGSSPNGETLDGVFYQVDNWTAPWLTAASGGSPGTYSATPGPLAPGLHIGYAFGTDGQESTSTTTGSQNAPAIGSIMQYQFLVAPPIADVSAVQLDFGNQQTQVPSSAQTVTLGNAGGTALTFSYAFTGNNAGDFSEGPGDTCGSAGGQLAPSASCTISVVFTPSTTGAETASVTITDNSNDLPGSVQNVSLSGTGSAVPTFTLSVAEAGSGLGSVTSVPSGISCQPACSASFNQGTTVTLTAAPNAGSTFAGWSGAGCSGTGPCVVTLNASQTVTATFTLTAATACSGTATIWTGGASGNWSSGSNWSTGVAPNGASANVCITDGHAAAQVTLDIVATVGNLFIDSGSTLTVSNNQQLTLAGTVFNAGVIQVSAAGNNTVLAIQGNVTLTGGGTVKLSTTGGGTAIINQNGSSTLTNVNNVIQGEGQIGNNGLTVVNQAAGTINGNLGQALLVNVNTALSAGNPYGLANQGTLLANGGTLQLSGSTIDNAGGTISATGSGSAVQLINSVIVQGGTFSSSGGATLGDLGDFFATLDGSTHGPVTNTGTFTLANDSQVNILGTSTIQAPFW